MGIKKSKKRKGQLYIVEPLLEQLLEKADNRKECAYAASREYSNFAKLCKMKPNPTIDSYVECANAFGYDVMIVHLPKGTVDTTIPTHEHLSGNYQIVKQEDLIILLNKLCDVDRKRVEQHILQGIYQLSKDHQGLLKSLRYILRLLLHIIKRYGRTSINGHLE